MRPLRRARNTAIVLLGTLVLVAAVGSSASAQVPETPQVPEPVTDALAEVQATLIPVLTEAALAAEPAANALGFALRPGCSGAGTVVVVGALLGATLPLPVSPGLVLTPVFIMCGAAFSEGPADPVLEQVDAAAGPAFEDAAQPVLDQLATALAPARPNLSEACSAASLFGSAPQQLPPPLHRLALLAAICG